MSMAKLVISRWSMKGAGTEHTITEFVENDGDLLSMLLGKDVVQESSLPRTKITSHYCDGYFGLRCISGVGDEIGDLFVFVVQNFGVGLRLNEAWNLVVGSVCIHCCSSCLDEDGACSTGSME
jgi:hypothetical protein